MFLSCWDVKIITTRSDGPAVRQWTGQYRSNHEEEHTRNRLPGMREDVANTTGGTGMSSRIHRTHQHGKDGVQPPGTNNHIPGRNHISQGKSLGSTRVQLYWGGEQDTSPDKPMGLSKEMSCSNRNRWETTERSGSHDPEHTTLWRGSPQSEDADSQCSHICSLCHSGCSPGPTGQRSEISRLLRHFRVRLNFVQRLHY